MKSIAEIYRNKSTQKPVISFEFFPPKNTEGEKILFSTIEEIKKMNPAFVSVTYGAGGSTRGKTGRWVEEIQNNHHITSMAHFTCIGASRDEVRQAMEGFNAAGIKNIMALRGDLPKDQADYKAPADSFAHANELIAYIRNLGMGFSIGGACYPEKHQDAATLDEDIAYLKQKVDSGTDFLISQLFFDNTVFFEFLEKCAHKGIQVPIIPGIMPITSFSQIQRFTSMAACQIPDDLISKLEKAQDKPVEFLKLSIDYSVAQCQELVDHDVAGIHFYTLNRSSATQKIMKLLGV